MKTNTKNTLLKFTITAVLLLVLNSCSTEPLSPEIIRKDDFTYADKYLDWAIETTMDKFEIPGCSVAVVTKDEILFQRSYGIANTENKIPVTNDTFFRVGSISKPVVALAIMKLVQQGKLDLDAPLIRSIPEFAVKTHFPDAPAITLRHILCHKSGMQGDFIKGIMGENRLNQKELIEALANEYVCFPPEEVFYYSNTAYSLLQTVIERASGMEFEDYMQTEILDPIGMKKSSFRLPSEMTGSFAAGHMKPTMGMLPDGTKSSMQVSYMAIRDLAAGGLHSNTNELVYLLQYLLSDKDTSVPRIVSEKSFREMTTIQFPEVKKEALISSDYGLGLMSKKLKYSEVNNVYQHTGNVNGFYSYMVFSPSMNIGLILCTNSNDGFFGTYSIVSRSLRKYFEARIGHPIKSILPQDEAISVTKKDLLKYEGTYGMIGVTAKVKALENRLLISAAGFDQTLELIPRGNDRFQPVARFLLWDIDIAPMVKLEKIYLHFVMEKDTPVGLNIEAIAGEGTIKLSLLKDSVRNSGIDTSQFAGKYSLLPDPRTEEALNAYIPLKEFELFAEKDYVILTTKDIKTAPEVLMYPLSDTELILMGTNETIQINEGILSFSGIKAKKQQ